jgi:hypothetical protein
MEENTSMQDGINKLHMIINQQTLVIFTFLKNMSPSFHTLFILFNTHIDEWPVELICELLLQNLLLSKQEVFNYCTRQESIILKGIFWKLKSGVDWNKFKNEKPKRKGFCSNCGIKGHFVK